MLSVIGRRIAIYVWPDGPGETVLYQADARNGGIFFTVIGQQPDVTISATTRKKALRWMRGAGVKRIAEPRPAEQISRMTKGQRQRKRAS